MASFRCVTIDDDFVPLEGELVLSSDPEDEAFYRCSDNGPLDNPCLIDYVMNLLDERQEYFDLIACCDLEAETTLAAAIAAGAKVSTDLCCDVANFTERKGKVSDPFRGNPHAKILKAYIQYAYGQSLTASAEGCARFWSEMLNCDELVTAWANEYKTAIRFPCGMIYREVLDDVTMAWSYGYPLPYIATNTFLWLKPLGTLPQMYIGTVDEQQHFMADLIDILRHSEQKYWTQEHASPFPEENNWKLSPIDRRFILPPEGGLSILSYRSVFRMTAKTISRAKQRISTVSNV